MQAEGYQSPVVTDHGDLRDVTAAHTALRTLGASDGAVELSFSDPGGGGGGGGGGNQPPPGNNEPPPSGGDPPPSGGNNDPGPDSSNPPQGERGQDDGGRETSLPGDGGGQAPDDTSRRETGAGVPAGGGSGPTATGGSGELPFTGFFAGAMAAIGGALVAGGATLRRLFDREER